MLFFVEAEAQVYQKNNIMRKLNYQFFWTLKKLVY